MANQSLPIPQTAAGWVNQAFNAFCPTDGQLPTQAIDCYFIANRDGSVRWVWPATARQPQFIRFYHAGTWRSRLYVLAIKMGFALGLRRLLANGACRVQVPAAALHPLKTPDSWALFTGTIGPNRKQVLWYTNRHNESWFAKLGVGEQAPAILQREQQALQAVNSHNWQHIIVPRVGEQFATGFAQHDVAAGTVAAGAAINSWPAAAVTEWMTGQVTYKPLRETAVFARLQHWLSQTDAFAHHRLPGIMLTKLRQLMHSLSPDTLVAVAPAHGDCTPWNVRLRGQQVVMIDWELYLPEAPALFDFFHYEYQSRILMGNKGFRSIRENIDAQLQQPAWQARIQDARLDVALLEKLYLLYNVAYYLQVYASQKEWHMQVQWLLHTWSAALTHWLMPVQPARYLLLQDMSVQLHNMPHAAMKLRVDHLVHLPEESDLDLCVSREGARSLLHFLQQHQLVHKVLVRRRSHMMQLSAILQDGSTLHVDAIWQFRRRSIDFLKAPHVLQTASQQGRGVNQPLFLYDFLYTWLFYLLNKASVPEHYAQAMQQAGVQDVQTVLNYLEEHAGIRLSGLQEVIHPAPGVMLAIHAWINSRLPNRGAERRVNQLAYGWDTLRDLFQGRGLVITFSGVDGAGKSTVISEVRQQIEKRLRRRVVVLRHRPSLLPILSAWKYGQEAAETKAANTLPRQGANKSSFSSLLRFAYYYCDYLMGQFYVYARYVLRGYVVLYDRYYFDFINDSVRSNIRLPKKLLSAGYHLLLKPRLNFFLYASPEEILARKQELNAATIEQLTRQYRQLFTRLSEQHNRSQYLQVHNQDLDRTLQLILGRVGAAVAEQ